MQNISKISIAIPYHQTGKTALFLSRLLKTIERQTYKNYEIILTSDGEFARNHNSAISKATGDIVQMMQMDDYFTHPESLQNIVTAFETHPKEIWCISACVHHNNGRESDFHLPEWTDDIFTGNNRLGGVSTLSFRRDKTLFFEEPLSWLVDCDLYYRLYIKYGKPIILNTPNISIDVRTDRLTHTLSDELKINEMKYLMKKYGAAHKTI